MYAKRSHTHVKDPAVHVKSSVDYTKQKHKNNQACTKSVSLHNAEVGHHTEEEKTTLLMVELLLASEAAETIANSK